MKDDPQPKSWHDVVTPEQRQRLEEIYPGLTLDEIAIQAMQNPKFAKAFRELGARVVYPNKIHADP